jgi:hypothetical protein
MAIIVATLLFSFVFSLFTDLYAAVFAFQVTAVCPLACRFRSKRAQPWSLLYFK